MGRWDNASLGFGGVGTPIPGGVHWIMAPSGYPMYLSDVLTGTASYTRNSLVMFVTHTSALPELMPFEVTIGDPE